MIRTYGAFSRDPLYNGLRLRNVDVSCDMEYVLSPEDIDNMTVDELNGKLNELFTFDNFEWQIENKGRRSEPRFVQMSGMSCRGKHDCKRNCNQL